MGRKKTHDEFLQELKERNINVEPLEKYSGMLTKIKFKYNDCGYIWEVTPHNLFRNKKCQRCNKKERYTKDSFIQKLNKINNNIIIIGEYINTKTKIKCKCNICGAEWRATPSKLLWGTGCPICAKKNLQIKENINIQLII